MRERSVLKVQLLWTFWAISTKIFSRTDINRRFFRCRVSCITLSFTSGTWLISSSTLWLKKGYHPTPNDNFNNSCPIPVIFVQILLSKYAIERWFDIPPRLFIVRTLPWETLRPRKITSSAVNEHLFELLVFYLSITFVSYTRSQ